MVPDHSRSEATTNRGSIGARAVLLLTLLSNCGLIDSNWTTLETNFGNSIVEQRLNQLRMPAANIKEMETTFQNDLVEHFEKAGHLQSNDALRGYLLSSGMDCSLPSSAKQTCRFSRYRIEQLNSGDWRDGASRIDWDVAVTWNRSEAPVRPTVSLDRKVRTVNKAP